MATETAIEVTDRNVLDGIRIAIEAFHPCSDLDTANKLLDSILATINEKAPVDDTVDERIALAEDFMAAMDGDYPAPAGEGEEANS